MDVPVLGNLRRQRVAAKTFLDRWLRQGVIATFGVGFTLPYLNLLNEVEAEGDAQLDTLPRRNVVFLANHQTYFMEALAFFDLVYVRHQLRLDDPVLRFSAAEETMRKNVLTQLFKMAGGITFQRSFRAGGAAVERPVDKGGALRVQRAIRDGWLLHFPAGTTQPGAPLRPGVARLLHARKATAVPVRVDGFRELLLHKQLPGKLLKKCRLTLHPPLDLAAFYAAPYTKESGAAVLERLGALINDRA